MLADALAMAGAYVAAFLGAGLVLLIVVHAYATWSIRNIDQNEET